MLVIFCLLNSQPIQYINTLKVTIKSFKQIFLDKVLVTPTRTVLYTKQVKN